MFLCCAPGGIRTLRALQGAERFKHSASSTAPPGHFVILLGRFPSLLHVSPFALPTA